jgi:hypothetical protein
LAPKSFGLDELGWVEGEGGGEEESLKKHINLFLIQVFYLQLTHFVIMSCGASGIASKRSKPTNFVFSGESLYFKLSLPVCCHTDLIGDRSFGNDAKDIF